MPQGYRILSDRGLLSYLLEAVLEISVTLGIHAHLARNSGFSKQLHHLRSWPSLGQTQVLQGSLRNKPTQVEPALERSGEGGPPT